jgi:hypothetical protein
MVNRFSEFSRYASLKLVLLGVSSLHPQNKMRTQTPQSSNDIFSKLVLSRVTYVSLMALAVTFLPVKPAVAADSWCWCTNYVAKKFQLSWDFKNANQWNDSFAQYGNQSYLQKNGFREVAPQKGAIVVMESSFSPNQWNAGHVGIVENVVNVNGRTYLDVRGANQGTMQSADAGCSNVNVIRFGTAIDDRKDISFWSKGNVIPSVAMLVTEPTNRTLDSGGNTYPYLHNQQLAWNPYHKWELRDIGGGKYMIISTANNRPLDGGAENGGRAYLHPQQMPSNPYQQWKLQPARSGYMVINVATGRALDSGAANGTQVYMHPTPMPGNTYHVWKLQ